MTLHEDTVKGSGSDITGDPAPTRPRQPNQIKGDLKKGVNQNRAPQVADRQKTQGQPEKPVEETAADPEALTGDQASQSGMVQQPPAKSAFPQIDWAQRVAGQPWLAYQNSRHVADALGAFMSGTGVTQAAGDAVHHVEDVWGAAADPKAISTSVHNIWEQNSAQAEVAKILLSGGATLAPQANQQQQAQTAADATSAVLPMAANPTNPIGASRAGLVGVTAAYGASAAASGDPHEQTTALVSTALMAMIVGRAHIPEATAKQMAASFGKWPDLEKVIGAIVGARRDFAKAAAQPGDQHLKDIVDHYLKLGPFEGAVSRMARGAPAVKAGAYGQDIVQKSPARARQAVAKAAGVDNWHQFLQKAADEGITDKRLIKFVVDNYPRLGLTEDLQRVNPADVFHGDPRQSLQEIHDLGDPARTGWAIESSNAFRHLLEHVHSGLWATSSDSALATVKNLAGHNRPHGSTDLIYERWMASMQTLAKQQGLSGEAIGKAVTGDQAAFDALPPEGQMIAKQWGMFRNALRHEAKDTGYSKDHVGNWLPFVFKQDPSRAARGGGGRYVGALVQQGKQHKLSKIGTDPAGNLVGMERFANAQEANADAALKRSNLVNELTAPGATLRKEIATGADAGAAKAIQRLAVSDPAAAYEKAREFARDYYQDFETDFFKIAGSSKARNQIKAIRTGQALNQFTEMLGKDGQQLAAKVTDSHQFARWSAQGYKALAGKQFEGYLFHPDLHPDLQRYVDHEGHGLSDVPVLKQLRQIEGKTVGYIMYSPPIHGQNLLARLGVAALMNPIEMTHYLLNGRALLPHMKDVESNRLRAKWIDRGVAPPSYGKNWFDNLSGQMGNALGHVDEELGKTPANGTQSLADKYQHYHQMVNDYFWNWARDMQVMMAELEETAALKHGMSATDAALHGGQRGKTWLGLMNPEDQNPILHDSARLVMFAPEWWKSYAQLLVPIYTKSGMERNHALYAAYQGAKFVAAGLMFQKMSGNLLNYMLTSTTPWSHDGHFQNGNLAGNQDRIEATAPWLDHIPGFTGVVGEDSKTGGRRTLENAWSRQERDLETAMGLESGQPGWKPENVGDGLSKVAVARLAPLLDGMAAAFNVDLYRSVAQKSWAHVDPSQPGGLSPLSPLYAALMMTPLGSYWSEQMFKAASDPNALQPTKGPFGATMPKSISQMLGNTGSAIEKTLFSWLTGVNPPYSYAEKTAGQPVSDESYKQYNEAKTQYQKDMASYSAQTLGGQQPPSWWLAQYRKSHATYSAIATKTFQNAPHDVYGAEGMLNSYEALYEDPKVKNPDGSENYDALRQLQVQWRAKYSAGQLSGMDQLLNQNDTKYPMLSVYHKTFAAYDKWQQAWADKNKVDLSKLHQEIAAYGALYGDQRKSAQYLAQHRDLVLYERAKKTEWEQTPAGLMYGLFYNSPTVSRYMQAKHETPQQVEQQVLAS